MKNKNENVGKSVRTINGGDAQGNQRTTRKSHARRCVPQNQRRRDDGVRGDDGHDGGAPLVFAVLIDSR